MPHNHTRYKMHQSTERAKLSSASRHSARRTHLLSLFYLGGQSSCGLQRLASTTRLFSLHTDWARV